MSTLILHISKRKVPLLERLHLLYPLSRIGTHSEVVPSIPSLWPRRVPLPPGPILFPGRIPLLQSARALIASRRVSASTPTHHRPIAACFHSIAQRRPLGPGSRRICALSFAFTVKKAMPPGPTRTASLRAKPFRKRGLMPSCRTCARTGCCSSQASFPRYRCRSRPADR